jgi:acyl carrier protein
MSDLIPQIKQILSGLFNVSIDTLSEESSAADIDAWDSLGQLMVIVELEQQFGVQISPERGEELTSIAKIAEFLRSQV